MLTPCWARVLESLHLHPFCSSLDHWCSAGERVALHLLFCPDRGLGVWACPHGARLCHG